ncbi:MAG: cellulase family glycosylhydrolase [Clostridiales bacterium]|nr:cellulase family glycosylhydrolase [Clostridiales bacterium]
MREFTGFTKGINLGGWLSQFEEDTELHRSTFITESDIEKIASFGMDHVRLPVDYNVLETESGEVKESGYSYIDKCISWCSRYGLNVIIDLHKTYGYSFDPMDKDDKAVFFHKASLQSRFYSLWKTIASRYGSMSSNVAFELLNEIVLPSVKEEWNEIALRAISEIRSVAPSSWIVFGGVCYNSVGAVPWLAPVSDKKIVYTFHCYEPMVFSHQGAFWVENMPTDLRISYPASLSEYREKSELVSFDLAGLIYDERLRDGFGPAFFEMLFEDAIKTAEDRDVPLYCGEYGVIENATAEDTLRWLSDINDVFCKYNMARSYWSYKKMNFGITDDRCKELLPDLVSKL